MLAAPAIVWISAPGFHASADKFDVTVSLLRVTFPYILFISLTALAGGVLNTYSRFSVPAFTPTLLNLSFIAFALFAAPHFDPPIMALAWAVVVGGVLQLAFQVPFLRSCGCCRASRSASATKASGASHGSWGRRSSASRSARSRC